MMTLIRVVMWTMIGLVMFTFMSCMQNLKADTLPKEKITCWSMNGDYDHKVEYKEKSIIIPCLTKHRAIFFNVLEAKEYRIHFQEIVGQPPLVI